MADNPLSQVVLYARREGGTAYGLRYVCDDVPAPLRAVVIHLDAKTVNPPGELRIGINADDPEPQAPPSAEAAIAAAKAAVATAERRSHNLEVEAGALRDRLIQSQARVRLLERRLDGLLKHRALATTDPRAAALISGVDLYREVLAEERREDKERKTRSTDKRFVKKRR